MLIFLAEDTPGTLAVLVAGTHYVWRSVGVRGEGVADADSHKATQAPTGREVETPFKESRARLPQVAFNVAEKYNFYLIL